MFIVVALVMLLGVPTSDVHANPSRLPDLGAAPELRGIAGWINSPPLRLRALRGRVVLVKFWTFSCINCIHTLDATREWYDAYQGVEELMPFAQAGSAKTYDFDDAKPLVTIDKDEKREIDYLKMMTGGTN